MATTPPIQADSGNLELKPQGVSPPPAAPGEGAPPLRIGPSTASAAPLSLALRLTWLLRRTWLSRPPLVSRLAGTPQADGSNPSAPPATAGPAAAAEWEAIADERDDYKARCARLEATQGMVREHHKLLAGSIQALVVGVLVTLTASVIGYYVVKRNIELYQVRAQRIEQQYAFLTEFSDKFPFALDSCYKKQDAYVWLLVYTMKTDVEPYSGKTRKEFLRMYEDRLQPASLRAPTLLSLTSRVPAYFGGTELEKEAEDLYTVCNALLDVGIGSQLPTPDDREVQAAADREKAKQLFAEVSRLQQIDSAGVGQRTDHVLADSNDQRIEQLLAEIKVLRESALASYQAIILERLSEANVLYSRLIARMGRAIQAR